jgi:hypothetical protein
MLSSGHSRDQTVAEAIILLVVTTTAGCALVLTLAGTLASVGSQDAEVTATTARELASHQQQRRRNSLGQDPQAMRYSAPTLRRRRWADRHLANAPSLEAHLETRAASQSRGER